VHRRGHVAGGRWAVRAGMAPRRSPRSSGGPPTSSCSTSGSPASTV
jgi:hypothetical protein